MKKIRTKLILTLIPIVVAPLLALGINSWGLIENMAREKVNTQSMMLVDSAKEFIKFGVSANKTQLEFLPQSQTLSRYLSAENHADKMRYLAPQVQLLFHQVMHSDPGILQIVLLNNKAEEEIQVGDGIDPFVAISPSNRIFLENMLHSGSQEYNQLIYSHEIGAFVFQQGLSFKPQNPELSNAGNEQESYVLLMTSSLKKLFDFVELQEKRTGFKLVIYDQAKQEIMQPKYQNLNINALLKNDGIMLNGLHYSTKKYTLSPRSSLICMIPDNLLFSELNKIKISLLSAISLVIIVLCFLGNWILNKFIIRPINELRHIMHQVTRTELHHIPLIHPDDEMTELHNQFSLMLSRLEASQLELEHSALLDSLTGLSNRSTLVKYLHKLVSQESASDTEFFITQIKLHNLSGINNTFGSRTGDQALQAMAQLLTDLLKKYRQAAAEPCLLARIGSDEFCFVLPPATTPGQLSAPQLCEQLARRLKKPVLVGEYELKLRFSAGIVSYPEAGTRVEDLLQSVNQARHQASRYTGNYWYQLDGAIAARLREDKWLESELSSALALQQLKVVFQPQYSLKTQRIIGAEVLLRWHHPEYGLVPPDRFIPIAEHSSQILDIDLWVLEQACRCQSKLQALGFEHFHLAINASATELSNPHYPQQVSRLLEYYHLDPASFGIEITETALVELDDVARNMVQTLKSLGVVIALDDFGTGYTSLNHLAALPLDMLKIDRSYTAHLEDNPRLVHSILQLADAFELQVVAEGVETREQLHQLIARGCDIAQGYLLSRPISEEALIALLCSSPDPGPWEAAPQPNDVDLSRNAH